MVSVVPFRRIRISTRLSVEETSTRLSQSVSKQTLFLALGKRGFQGRVTAHGFAIHRIVPYINSFLPWAYGEFKQEQDKCVIDATLMWHPSVMIVLPLLVLPFVLSGNGGILLPGYILAMVDYNREAHTLFRFLLTTANLA